MRRVLSLILNSLACGLFVALLAPAIAGALFGLGLLALPTTPSNPIDMRPGSLVLFAIGIASGTYLLGAIPAFIAGLALPALRRRSSKLITSIATGVIGCAVFLVTFGAHLLTQPLSMLTAGIYLIPAFLGIFVASCVFTVRHPTLQ